jgi:hypothetical protein
VPFQAWLAAVTVVPVWVKMADQPWLICCPAGNVNPRDQEVRGVVEVFLIFTVPVKPEFQSLVV